MPSTPYMPLYTSDYLGDTGHLSTEQHGAYLLILMQMWNAGGTLPNDDRKLARVARLSTKKWKGMAEEVLDFFTVSDDRISNDRMTKELEKVHRKSKSRASAGAKGGRAKALKNKEQVLANATDLPLAKPCHLPEPEPDNSSNELSEARAKKDAMIEAGFAMFTAAANRQPAWSVPKLLNKSRKASLSARLKEFGGLRGWEAIIERAEQSPFLTGQTPNQFSVTFDWLVKAANALKVSEGNYDAKPNQVRANAAQASGNARATGRRPNAFERFAERVENASGGQDAGGYDGFRDGGGEIIDVEPTYAAR